jgi:hypothetical protein
MGSTISTCKRIGAFQGGNGKTCYVMFEQTYSSNVFPQVPAWSAQMIGDLASTLKCIFASASSCEGGSLKGSGGRDITPEGYLSAWLKELSNPVIMRDLNIELKISDSYYSPITHSDFERVKAILVQKGANSTLEALKEGKAVTVSLHQDSELLSAIYDGFNVGAWRVIPAYEVPGDYCRNASLGWQPKKVKASEVETPRFLKISENDNNVLVQAADGSWRCDGWAYSCVGTFVLNLWKSELLEPGNFRSRIKAYRNAIHEAPYVPSDTTIVIDTTVVLEPYQHRIVSKVVEKYAHRRVGTDIHFAMPEIFEDLYQFTHLPTACTQWVIAESAPSPEPQCAQMSQLSLLV